MLVAACYPCEGIACPRVSLLRVRCACLSCAVVVARALCGSFAFRVCAVASCLDGVTLGLFVMQWHSFVTGLPS